MPKVLTDGEAVRQAVLEARQEGKTVGLVPTMGALHEGHLSLLDAARAECDLAVVSDFRESHAVRAARRFPQVSARPGT